MTAPLATFRLPLALAPTTNTTIGRNMYSVTKIRKRCHAVMLGQYLKQFGDVRERYDVNAVRRVVCTRRSSSKPDRHSNWSKIPVDVLCRRTRQRPKRLGLIFDDAERYAQIEEHWEYAPPGAGEVVIEVYEC